MHMWMEQISITNFKSIESLHLQFKPGINLLTGDNGVGKTTILEAVTVAMGDFLNGMAEIPKKGIAPSDVRIDPKNIADASQQVTFFTPTTIESVFSDGSLVLRGQVTRRDQTSSSRTRYLGNEIAAYAKEITNGENIMLPVFSYFSTSRLAPPKKEDFAVASKNKLNDRRCGYIGCFENNLDIKAIKAWCLKMEMAAFQQRKEITEYQAFNDRVSFFMSRMNDLDERPGVFYSRAFEDIVYTENGETLPVSYLSAGYQSLLWMVMDLAFRMALLNPAENDLRKGKGIVLIDEIDMHLHPKWQWKIVNTLQETFPWVQFVIATHSPIIISSCRNANLIQIDCHGQVQYLPDAYAFSVEDVLEFRQGSHGGLEEVRKLYEQFERAMNEDDYESAETILAEMTDHFGEDNTEVKMARMELNLL